MGRESLYEGTTSPASAYHTYEQQCNFAPGKFIVVNSSVSNQESRQKVVMMLCEHWVQGDINGGVIGADGSVQYQVDRLVPCDLHREGVISCELFSVTAWFTLVFF